MATKHWRLLGARSQGEVHGFYVAQLRRRMGVTAVREFARHRLRRAAYVGVPRAVVEQMMQQEAMRVRLHGQPAAEPPYADLVFAALAVPSRAKTRWTDAIVMASRNRTPRSARRVRIAPYGAVAPAVRRHLPPKLRILRVAPR